MNLCIIPARYGSKRIKNKNIREFCGKPIIDYAIESAVNSKTIDEVLIYTNDVEIRKRHPEFCNIVRPENNAGDDATLTDTLIEALKFIDRPIDNICLLLPCAMFINETDIDLSFKLLNGHDAVITFTKYSHPIERAFELEPELKMLYPDFGFIKTQDLIPKYHDAGQFYWLNVESFLKQKKIFLDNAVPYIIDAIDIDTEIDWNNAEALVGYKRLLEK